MPNYDPTKDFVSIMTTIICFLLLIGPSVAIPLAPLFFLLFPSSPAHIYSLVPSNSSDIVKWAVFILNVADSTLISTLVWYALMIFITAAVVYFCKY